MSKTTKTAATLRTILVAHYECEHEGDIERTHRAMKARGLAFRVLFTDVADGPEVGVSIIETAATDEVIAEATNGCCVQHTRPGTREDAEAFIAEAEGMHAYEYGDED